MNDGALVEVVSDSGGKNQFGKTLTYRNGTPRKKHIIFICVAIIVVVLVPALLSGPPTDETIAPTGEVFAAPSLTSDEKKLDLPDYSRINDIRTSGENKNSKTSVKFSGPQLLKRPRAVKMPPGAMVKAVLISGASNGLIKAEIKEPLNINGETLIEAGTVAVGSGTSSDSRLFIKFGKLVYRDGTVESTQAEAADDSDKTVGLKGSKIGYHALRLGAAIGLNFAGGLAEGLQDSQGQNGVMVRPPTMRNALLNGAATASLEQSREMMSSLKNDPPIIEIPGGENFYLIFSGSGE